MKVLFTIIWLSSNRKDPFKEGRYIRKDRLAKIIIKIFSIFINLL